MAYNNLHSTTVQSVHAVKKMSSPVQFGRILRPVLCGVVGPVMQPRLHILIYKADSAFLMCKLFSSNLSIYLNLSTAIIHLN
jgi:hypothetical protein